MITYNNAVKCARMDEVTAALGAAGQLVIGTSALSGATGILAIIPLGNPAAPPATGAGVLTITMPQSDTDADATGTAAKAELRAVDGTVVASGLTVGIAGTDIILGSTAIQQHNIITLTSAVITHG